jgi:predicted DsbA family dithiol-disulfide isomerase
MVPAPASEYDMTAPAPLRIDFVSDVSCPWCAIGLSALEQALERLDGVVQAEIHLQPFELNPQLAAEGEDATEHLMHKYGIGLAQVEANRAAIRERAAALGFAFNVDVGSRVYNTFDAHRLLHWAELQGRHLALKKALLRAYFTDGEDVASHEVLVRLATEAGLDRDEARAVLESGRYADEVRAQERFFQQRGIHSVPATIVNGTHLIPGGQPPEVFERALREIAATAPG